MPRRGSGTAVCLLLVTLLNTAIGLITQTAIKITRPSLSWYKVARPRAAMANMLAYAAPPGTSFEEAVSKAVSQALKKDVKLHFTSGGGYAGGGGASTGAVKDATTGIKYFYKSTGSWGFDMLSAEYEGVKEMYDTHTIRVPQPIVIGTSDANAFVVFEYLSIGGHRGGKSAELMGRVNPWKKTWAEFFDEARLGHIMKLCKRDGFVFPQEDELRRKVKQILSSYETVPSLIHGDLWTGNAGVTEDGSPVIFDPATYYGDREAEMAMTHLFGTFAPDFYKGYEAEWPLPAGHEERRVIFNLYHILNHVVLFGGGYFGQAQRMIGQILKL